MTQHTSLQRIDLSSTEWSLQLLTTDGVPEAARDAFADGQLPATVPGCVHDDLLRHHVIPDPYLGDAEESTHWVGRQRWNYHTSLPELTGSAERVDLVCDGLDTVALLDIDGHRLGETANMHRRYRFDLTDHVHPGANLNICFDSAYAYTDNVRAVTGTMPGPYDEPYALIRKMAANFGWDWGPTVVTAGIWRPIRLEQWSCARLASLRPSVTLTNGSNSGRESTGTGRIDVVVDIERAVSGQGCPLTARVMIAGIGTDIAIAPDETTVTATIDIPDVEIWWPHSLGSQPLYDLTVELLVSADNSDNLLDSWTQSVGFRQIDLDTSDDDCGRRFTFIVNGTPIFARGFNWIPNDALVTRVTPQDYRRRLLDAKEAGADLIRVWGGGIYEDDEFYRLCDELGLMVWQDFLFACSAYPETPELMAEVRAEAADNIDRLMPHPSLVLWNGNNENFLGMSEWGWGDVLGDRPWGSTYYLSVLPDIVRKLDPTRPYWPGSPYSGDPATPANDPDAGCFHSWVAWNERDEDEYLQTVPRFVSEFGWQGAATYTTLRDAIGVEHLGVDDPVLATHQKAIDGKEKMASRLASHIHPPTSFDAWHYATQVVQARAVTTGIDHWRASWPRCAGAVVWQLNDCWPAISWAAVDSSGRRKPVWYAIRDAFADRRATVQTIDGTLSLVLVNHGQEPWLATPHLCRVAASGLILTSWSPAFTVKPMDVFTMALPTGFSNPTGDSSELIFVDCDGMRHVTGFVPDREFSYPPSQVDITTRASADGAVITVKARSLVRDLLLQVDRIGANVYCGETGLTTLLPGESHEWHLTGVERVPSPEELRFPVIISMGDIERAS